MNYTPTCPYFTNVEVQAWGEGLTFALHGDTYLERNEANPYTSADTCVAWAQGWDDGKYKPALLNLNDINWASRAVGVQAAEKMGTDGVMRSYVVVTWNAYSTSDDAPAWASNRIEHRSIPLDNYELSHLMHYGIRKAVAVIELPCPPYDFTASGNDLTITAGGFTKTGTKAEWQAVLEDMNERVEALPDGFDVSNVSVSVAVSTTATATWMTHHSAHDLLIHSDQYNSDVWSGTEDELRDALEEAVGELDDSELNDDYADVEYELDYYAEMESEATDIDYDMSDVVEL